VWYMLFRITSCVIVHSHDRRIPRQQIHAFRVKRCNCIRTEIQLPNDIVCTSFTCSFCSTLSKHGR
jgi:hypothetical protein